MSPIPLATHRFATNEAARTTEPAGLPLAWAGEWARALRTFGDLLGYVLEVCCAHAPHIHGHTASKAPRQWRDCYPGQPPP
jgi:hypothetical protein